MKKIQTLISYTVIILLAVFARLTPHAPNFAPIGGLALFSGSHFKKKIALLIPITAMFLSDIFLGFHKTIPFVYLSFIIIALIGGLIKTNKWQSLLKASLVSSILFFFYITLQPLHDQRRSLLLQVIYPNQTTVI